MDSPWLERVAARVDLPTTVGEEQGGYGGRRSGRERGG